MVLIIDYKFVVDNNGCLLLTKTLFPLLIQNQKWKCISIGMIRLNKINYFVFGLMFH